MTDTIDGSVTFHGNAVPRLFVAVGLPDSFKAAVRQLQSGLPNARWVQADSLHLTLAFIGDVNEGTQRGIEAGLNSVSAPALDLNISGLGRFPPRGAPRVLWVGIAPEAGIAVLAQAVRSTLENIGMPGERREFRPHVTVARFRQRAPAAELERYLAANKHFRTGQARFASFHLFSSELRPGGARYTIERSFPLAD